MLWKTFVNLEADKGGGSNSGGQNSDGGGKGTGGQEGQQQPPLSYEAWVKEQPDEVKTMLSGWERGLKTALDGERDARKALEKQVRDLAGKAEKGSEAEKQLIGLADQIGEADRKTAFYETAHAAGVTNLKLAYTVAVQDEMFDKRGQVNFETMKAQYPELFGGVRKAPPGNAGAGTNTNQPAGKGMNDFIRKAAGRS